jgi:drug/metabolite transporter (DMT)-like permease
MTALVALTQIAGFQGLVQWALVSGGVGKISLMAYTMPFWVVLFSWVFLGDRPRGLHWAGIGLAALGLVCVIEPWHALGDTLAVLLGLAGGLCWGVATVVAKMALARYNPDVVAFTAWQMLLGGLMLAPVAWLAPQITAIWNLDLVLGMAYVVLAASAGGWLLWFLVVRRLPASIAGLSSLAVPICAALLAWLLLGERPDPVEGLGMAIILVGLFVVSRATSHPAPAAISPVPRNLQ